MHASFVRIRALLVCGCAAILLLGGCASTGNPRDPLEPINRAIYKFNDGVDTVVLRPAAEVYRGVLPQFVRTGVSNFFSNINDVLVALNNLLQGKIGDAASDASRAVVNTSIGLLGLLDVATAMGMEKHNEDFGQTLGRWGVGDGPYLVLPLLGPSNLRDAIGRIADHKTDLISYVDPTRNRNQLLGLRVVQQRAELLGATNIFETAALDPYEFLRDAYLQRRRNLVYDGNPPPETDGDFELKPGQRSQLPDSAPFPQDADGARFAVTALTSQEAAPAAAKPDAGTVAATAAAKPDPVAVPRAPAAAYRAEPQPPRVVRFWGTTSSILR